VRILANPMILRAAIVFFCAAFAFLLGLLSIRMLKNSITEESDVSDQGSTSLETLPLALYNTVIQQLKQQKNELIAQSQLEQNRARTNETFSQAVLSNLSSGVLVFGVNGLVKSSNPAAKSILGFGSVTGLSPEDVFRGAIVRSRTSTIPAEAPEGESPEPASVAEEVHAVLRQKVERRQVEADYETPSDERRFLAITISPVTAGGSLLGIACLINDLSELDAIRRQQEERGSISDGMAQRLRTSLVAISGYAQQLAQSHDSGLAQQLAEDIAHQAAGLEKEIGGFLATQPSGRSAAAGNSGD
jgi:PAS domain-containing protein